MAGVVAIVCAVARSLPRWREALDRLLGLPNYERYIAHMQAAHPECAPLSRRSFYDEAQRRRYESGPDRPRCC
jgi:uncharacterized short protein YbdD (DUF466 family)